MKKTEEMIENIFEGLLDRFKGKSVFSRVARSTIEATGYFLLSPRDVTEKKPHIRDGIDLKRFMITVVFALVPVILFGIYNIGRQKALIEGLEWSFAVCFFQGLLVFIPIAVVTFAVGGFWELLFSGIRGHQVNEGFLVTGALFPLIMPPSIPLWQVALGISFGVVIGKEVFGGTGMNIMNPALTGRAFLFFAYPASLSGNEVWVAASPGVDAVSRATPLSVLSVSESSGTPVEMLKEAGYTFKDLFIGDYTGTVGGTSTLAILFGAAVLIITGVASYRIIVGATAGLVGASLLFNIFGSGSNVLMALPVYYHLVVGGFAFGVVFMATDPVSAPYNPAAKWVYGLMIGILVVFVRSFNAAFTDSTMLAILLMNVFSPLIDYVFMALHKRKRGVVRA